MSLTTSSAAADSLSENRVRQSESPSSEKRVHPAAVLFWLLIILTPFICAGLIWLITGTDPLKLDAWNTSWNDEVGYFRVIRLLRHEFYPQGMYGFNEDAPSHLAYGPYNIFTYLPYFVLSFATGIDSHNFIYYSNVILAVLACAVYAVLVRPRFKEGVYTVLFLSTYLVAGRYIWSGMSESSYNFFLILFTALAIWMIKKPDASPAAQGTALFVMIAAVFFWNTMRPYYFPLLLVPVYMIFRKRSRLSTAAKILFLLFAALSAGLSLWLFFFFTDYNVARYFFDSTGGAFDLTVYPLMVLWGFTGGEHHVPSDEELAETLSVVGADRVRFDAQSGEVQLDEGQAVDLGGIAKGYTSARIMEIYREHGLRSGLVSLGGNVQCLGAKPDGSAWRIGVRNPDTEAGGIVAVVAVKDMAVISSGGYERFFVDEETGVTYEHIMDPKTGRPVHNELAQVTIVTPDGTLGDGLSTALYILGLEAASDYWRAHSDEFDAVFVGRDGQIWITAGLADCASAVEGGSPLQIIR